MINAAILSDPFNWIKVGLMAVLFFVGVKLIADFVGATPKLGDENG